MLLSRAVPDTNIPNAPRVGNVGIEKGFEDYLVTTDDLGGVRQARIREVIDKFISGNAGGDKKTEFSLHHYSL